MKLKTKTFLIPLLFQALIQRQNVIKSIGYNECHLWFIMLGLVIEVEMVQIVGAVEMVFCPSQSSGNFIGSDVTMYGFQNGPAAAFPVQLWEEKESQFVSFHIKFSASSLFNVEGKVLFNSHYLMIFSHDRDLRDGYPKNSTDHFNFSYAWKSWILEFELILNLHITKILVNIVNMKKCIKLHFKYWFNSFRLIQSQSMFI